MQKYYRFALVMAIVGLSIGVYWNSLRNQFVNMDDLDLIVRNPYIKTLTWQNLQAIFTPGVVGSYQPVRTLSYALDYHFWQLNPLGYHLTNIFCHAVSTFLIYLIVAALAQDFLIACLTALLFAVHPVHVEAVTWLSGRRDVLAAAFALLSFYSFLRFLNSPPGRGWGWVNRVMEAQRNSQEPTPAPPGRGIPTPAPPGRGIPGATAPRRGIVSLFYILALVFFTLGLLTKSSVVVLPLLFVFYEVCFRPPCWKNWRRMWLYAPFLLVTIGFLWVFIAVSRASGVARATYHGGDAYATFLIMLRVFAEYLYLLVAPRQLSLTYGVSPIASFWEPSLWLALLVLGIIGGLTIVAWKKAKFVFFGIGWFFISLLPVSNLIPIGVVKADRYLYLPSVGFCLIFAWLVRQGWTRLVRFTPLVPPASGGMKGAEGNFAEAHATASSPRLRGDKRGVFTFAYWLMIASVVVAYALLTIQRNRDWQDSETLWTATLDADPHSTIALNNLGLIYAERGLYDKALVLYEKLLDDAPQQDHVERVYANMAEAYTGKQMFDEALAYYQKALETDPAYIRAYLGLAQATLALGQYDQARRICQNALELEPQNAAIYNQLGNLAFMQGNYDEARAHYQKALTLNPAYIAAYNGLGASYANQGEKERALAAYQKALEIEPDAAVIRNSLGSLYLAQGETVKAITEFQASVQADPNNADGRNNLGVLLLQTGRAAEALGELIASLKLQPENPKVLSNLGLAYAQVGLAQEAIRMCRWALQIDASLFRTQVLLGDVCFGVKDLACAVEAYQNAVNLQHENQDVRKKLEFAKEQAEKQ